MPQNRLTAPSVDKVRPGEKIKVLADGAGLRLVVHPNGSKYWQLRFTIDGKESSMQLGQYPGLSLAQARELRDSARAEAKAGRSPVTERRIRKAENQQRSEETFRKIAADWKTHGETHPNKKTGRVWSLTHVQRNDNLVRNYLLPDLGDLPIQEISEGLLRTIVEAKYKAGKRESARRAAAVASQIFRFAKESGYYTGHNPAADLLNYSTLAKPKVKHFEALNSEQVGPMLRRLRESKISPVMQAALVLMLFTGLRDNSLRGAKWKEIDLESALWTVPGSRMKRGQDHAVPLPRQAIETLEKLKAVTYKGKNSYVFASSASKYGVLAENSIRIALHGLGFKVTAHGLRSLLTDVLNEQGFNRDAIERQLDHAESNNVRAAYLRSDFMAQRVVMMQWYANWCDAQAANKKAPKLPSNVVKLRAA